MLKLPDLNKTFYLYTDASDIGCGNVLTQDDGIIGFVSYKFSGYQLNWSVVEKERYSILKGFENWKYLLKGATTYIFTDSKNNTFITFDFSKKVERQKTYLNQFNIEYKHILGKENIIADYISRNKIEIEEEFEFSNVEKTCTAMITYPYSNS